jgi:excisionase family DNA binding protein
MERERRCPVSAERRRTHAPAARLTSDTDRFSRRIGPAWLSVAQLSRRWQLSRKTIYKFIDARMLPAWKVGSHLYRVATEDVLRFEGRLPPVRSDGRISYPPKERSDGRISSSPKINLPRCRL